MCRQYPYNEMRCNSPGMFRSVKFSLIVLLILKMMILVSCEDLIEYSPFDINIKSSELNIKEAGRIFCSNGTRGSDSLKFALFSDVHENYDDMADAISSINNQPDLKFVVCCGDITNFGLVQEFKWYIQRAKESLYPLITIIGNHDHLANGLRIFNKLFGDPNMSFTCTKYKFITFNNIMWENNNVSPKYKWLIDELSDTNFINVVFTHIPAFAGEIDEFNQLVYDNIIKSGNVKLCINGHFHYFDDIRYNGIRTILADAVDSREYYIIKLFGDQVFVENIKF